MIAAMTFFPYKSWCDKAGRHDIPAHERKSVLHCPIAVAQCDLQQPKNGLDVFMCCFRYLKEANTDKGNG